MKIAISYDQPESSLPAAFVGAINYVVAYYDTLFTNNVTVKINVGYGEINGQTLASGALGESEGEIYSIPYASVVQGLNQNAPYFYPSAVSSLPGSAPTASGKVEVTTAEAKALGIQSYDAYTGVDGYVGFSSSALFSYSATATPAANQYYFIGVAEHEISEVLGRVSDLDYGTGDDSVMDLYRYAAGQRDLTARAAGSNPAYFSVNGGQSALGYWNTNASGDLGDWASNAGNDAYLAFSSPGVINSVSATDIELMEALGWNSNGSTTSQLIQTDHTTSLYQDGLDFTLSYAGMTSLLTIGGAAAVAGQFGGWTPIGAIETSNGYEVAWKNSIDDDFTIWNVNTGGAYVSSLFGATAGGTYAVESQETTFGQDLNGDGTVGVVATLIKNDGATDLDSVGDDYCLFAHGTTTGYELTYGGAAATLGEFSNWSPIAAVQTGGGYDIAWKNSGDDDFTVWSVNSSGAYVTSLIGSVPGNSYSLESLESTFGLDLNGDGTTGLVVTSVVSTDNTTDLALVGDNYGLFAHGTTSGVELTFGGGGVTAGEFGAWTPIGAVAVTGGYDVAWSNSSDDDFTAWSVNSAGAYVANLVGAVTGTNQTLEGLETTFNQDLNGDGTIGVVNRVIATDNSTDLRQTWINYYLDPAGHTTGPELSFGGGAVTVGEFGSWSPIGAVAVTGGYDVAWKNSGDDDYTVWSVGSSGAYVTNLIGAVPAGNLGLEILETTFNQNLNGDGVTGILATTLIKTDGSTDLDLVGSNYALVAHGTATGVELTFGGVAVTAGEFGGWNPIGAIAVSGGYDLAWKNSADDDFTVWNLNSAAAYVSSSFGAVAANTPALEALETTFGQDLNGDGVTGVSDTLIKTAGATDLDQFANAFYLIGHGTTLGPELSFGGSAVTSGEFGSWAPVAAAQTGSGYEVAWNVAGTSDYTFWDVDSSGAFTADSVGEVAATSVAAGAYETVFNLDLNGDGVVGLNTTGVANSGKTTLTLVAGDYDLNPSTGGTGPTLSYAGSPVTAGEFGGWTPLGAEQLSGGGYEVAWKMAGADEFTIWKTNSSGAYSSTLVGATNGSTLV